MSALVIVMVAAPMARGDQPVGEAPPRPVKSNVDASSPEVDEAERARLQAEYSKLTVEHDALEARLASLEAEAAEERQRPLSLGPWEVLGVYWGVLLLAVLWAWGWKSGRRT